MAQVHLPGIARDYVWDCGNDGSAAPAGTPWLQIYSGGHDGFQQAPWVDKGMGGKGSACAGTFTMQVWPGQKADNSDAVIAMQCKGPDGVRWEIVIDVNGAVTNDWARGAGYWQIP